MNKIFRKLVNINTQYSDETRNEVQNEVIEVSKKNETKHIKETAVNIWKLVREYKVWIFLAIFASIIGIIAGVFMSLSLQPLVDAVIAGDLKKVYSELLTPLILLVLSTAVFSFIGSTIMAVFSQIVVYNLRNKTFDHVQKLEIRFFDTRNSGSIISTFINDIELLSTALDQSIAKSIISVIKIIVVLGAILYINMTIGILIVLLSVVYFGAMYYFSKKAKVYTDFKQESLSRLNGYSEEMLSAISMLKTNNATDLMKKNFENKVEKLRYAEESAQIYGGMVYEMSRSLRYFIYMILALVGGNLAIKGIITVGTIAAYTTFVSQLTEPAMELSTQITILLSAISGTSRVFEILEEETEDFSGDVELLEKEGKKYWVVDNNEVEVKGHIEFKDVEFGYNENKKVLKGISLYAKPGQKIAFIGATGAGKTTVINLVNRFYDITSGEILLDGINIKRINKKILRSQITTVLQDTNIFTGTIIENIRNGNFDATDEEIIEACKKTRANIFIEKLEDGYNTVINPDETKLSQGELQLISITRALVSKPIILILDEATSSVDTNTEKLVTNAMDVIMSQSTSLVIAHRLSTIQNSKAILLIEDGKIVERGEHDQLMDEKGKYYELYTGKSVIS